MTAPPPHGFSHVIGRLWAYGRRYWLYFAIAVVATVLGNFANLIRPYLIKILTDQILTGKSLDGKMTLLGWLLAGLMGSTLVKGVFTYLQGYTLNRGSQGTVRDLREAAYDHLQRLPIGWFDRSRVGDILVRFTDDQRVVTEFMTSGLTVLTNDTMILVTSLLWMVVKDWRLTILAMVVSPLAGLVVRRFSKRVQQATAASQERLSNLSSLVAETVRGIKVVKSFNQEGHETRRFSEQSEDSFRWAMRIVQYTATQSPILEVLATSGIALVMYYCALNIVTGSLTLGDLMAFWAYMLMATTPINRMNQTLQTVHRGCTAAGRLLDILDVAAEGRPAQPQLPAVQGRIELRDVHFRYDAARDEALRGVSLIFEVGEHVAVVGRNGAGKSTLANLIPRFYEPQAGAVLIDGHATDKVTLQSLRRQIGIVAQETLLFSGSIRDNIAYGCLDASDDQVEKAARAAGAHDFISALPDGYQTKLGEHGSGLSGGQRQRLAIARMLVHDPPIVILDEATSNLDPHAERSIQEALEAATRGRTVINIAHRLAVARQADRVVVLDDGRVAESGSHDELLAKQGVYWQLYSEFLEER